MNDHKGAALLSEELPPADTLLSDKGCDSDGFSDALVERSITPCIPSRRNRKVPIAHDARLSKQRNFIARTSGRLKDRRRIATRYDR